MPPSLSPNPSQSEPPSPPFLDLSERASTADGSPSPLASRRPHLLLPVIVSVPSLKSSLLASRQQLHLHSLASTEVGMVSDDMVFGEMRRRNRKTAFGLELENGLVGTRIQR
ncbi:uncharacterized protein G2W53_010733 [Senna tora]|uniref:Uncharacterized protein n=1 Tax=Senna tora TaxID=362788 RepID=A0A835CA29_9FABA|nr:uncharacterized protein G2W53_010733 [Senna tora]